MDFKQLRTVLTDHFSRFLAARKAQIDETGPLPEADRMLMENTAAVAEMELADGEISREVADGTARDFIKRYELDIQPDGPLFEIFKRSIAQAQRDYAKAVLAYSADAESFDFKPIVVRFLDPITFFLTFFIVAVFVRAPIVTIAIIGTIAGPLLLRAFASLGDAEITGYRIAVASIVGVMHALIAIRMMSARRQKAMAATEARLAGER